MMAHFAKIDENNIVLEVNVVDNENVQNLPFPESEPVGIKFLTNWSAGYSNWKQTSYNKSFRKNYAGIGFSYDPQKDAFIAPKTFDSWVLNEQTCVWEAPVPYPNDGSDYVWSESELLWVKHE